MMRQQARQSGAASPKVRQDAAKTLSAASAAVDPGKGGLGKKLALASTALRLARRYPVAALVIGGIAVVYYLSLRQGRTAYRSAGVR